MSRGFGPQISLNELLASQSRTVYEAAGWGDLSTEELEAMRARMDVACPDIARDAKIRSMGGDLVIENPGIATDEQIARLRRWLLDEEALRTGSTAMGPTA
jgi:hypothetical protein